MKRQAAREKLRKLVAPLFTSPPGGPSGVQAMGAVRPRISVSFEGLSVALQDGTPVLNGVTGRFSHSKVASQPSEQAASRRRGFGIQGSGFGVGGLEFEVLGLRELRAPAVGFQAHAALA